LRQTPTVGRKPREPMMRRGLGGLVDYLNPVVLTGLGLALLLSLGLDVTGGCKRLATSVRTILT